MLPMYVSPSWPGKSNIGPSYHYKGVDCCLGKWLDPQAGQLRQLLHLETKKVREKKAVDQLGVQGGTVHMQVEKKKIKTFQDITISIQILRPLFTIANICGLTEECFAFCLHLLISFTHSSFKNPTSYQHAKYHVTNWLFKAETYANKYFLC